MSAIEDAERRLRARCRRYASITRHIDKYATIFLPKSFIKRRARARVAAMMMSAFGAILMLRVMALLCLSG